MKIWKHRQRTPNGEALRAPMHIYHMTHQDAQEIVAYLKSLPTPVR